MTAPAWGTAEPAVDGLYAVVGFFLARDPYEVKTLDPRRSQDGRRFFDHITAADPRTAEDKARAEFGGQVEDGITYDLAVCAVLTVADGQIKPVDTYATYLDPDEVERA